MFAKSALAVKMVNPAHKLTDEERQSLRNRGYRPVEIWLPDFGDPQVREQAIAEAKRIAAADHEEDVMTWLEAVQKDMWEGEDQI
jgi:hypothetical protein